MSKTFKIYYTSDSHGYLLPLCYATQTSQASGLIAMTQAFTKDGNTLIIDGGDTIQGSPLTMYLATLNQDRQKRSHPVASVLNKAGYDYVALGNHDFNYGRDVLDAYLDDLNAKWLCANLRDKTGKYQDHGYDIKVLENGLKVGIVGITTDYVNVWEKPEHIEDFEITCAFAAAKKVLAEIKDQVDVTICVYHGGFERDLNTSEIQSTTTENMAYQICKALDFDLLLTAHQHMPFANKTLYGTHIVQPINNAKHHIEIDGSLGNEGLQLTSKIVDVNTDKINTEAFNDILELDKEVQVWLDSPVGYLSEALVPASKVEMALNGSSIADFFNQVQLAETGADISCTSLGNDVKGFDQSVTVRDVVSTYIYPNTLKVLEVTGKQLKQALERTSAYLSLDAAGNPEVSQEFLVPKIEHYNFDFFANVTYDVDLKQPVGSRVSNVTIRAKQVDDQDTFTLVMNDYRASGAGGYEMYLESRVAYEAPLEMAELIINYFREHDQVEVQKFERPRYCY